MISTALKIFVDANEFDFDEPTKPITANFKLDSGTSVARLKAHFFQTLCELGEVVKFSAVDAAPGGALAKALEGPDTLVASFHEPPPALACRLLQHTKGGLMLPGGFLDGWHIRDATVSIVTTEHQAQRLRKAFYPLPFHVFSFYPQVDPVFLDANEGAPRSIGDHETSVDLLYAGRWIANKGVCQLVRSLDRVPCGGGDLKLIGEYEPDFSFSQTGGAHINYPDFHEREILMRRGRLDISLSPSLPSELLVNEYKKAHIFAYPSFHEDENYGLSPREAACCGAIPVLTDLCGLGEFAGKSVSGVARTWATLGGIRYSLDALALEVQRLRSLTADQKRLAVRHNWQLVRSECSGSNSQGQLREALQHLLQKPPGPPPSGGWRCPSRIDLLAEQGPQAFREALACPSGSDPEGLYVEGLGILSNRYSEARFLAAIQGLYTTWPSPPQLRSGVYLHGFWRVSLWNEEHALVEFGFPGPRLLRFSDAEWKVVLAAARFPTRNEVFFEVKEGGAVGVFQRAIDLGYLVPDDPMSCHLPAPNSYLT
jgi:glycosyltransferase involved in cell wall biosynthesis